MRALAWFILGCAAAGCSETSAVDAGAPGGRGAATRGGSAAAPPAGAGGVGGLGGAAGVGALAGAAGGTACPADLPSPYGAVPCATEALICEYSFPLACPVGCSGGDYQSVQCANGIWVDYRHSVGAPTCRCSLLSFPAGMQGTWLMGWSGDLNHYSWIRFSALSNTFTDPSTPGDGTIEILAGEDALSFNEPFWPCSGQGRWFITQKPHTFELWLPSTCSDGGMADYTVTSLESAIPSYLPGCLLRITLESVSGAPLEACKYPDSQCDVTMATCQPIQQA